MSGQTASPARIVKYKTVCLFMCLFLLLFVAMGGESSRRWCIYISQWELWSLKFHFAEVSLQQRRRLHQGSSRLSFFFFSNCPGAGIWRWKMTGVTTFDRFIFQRRYTYITVTTVNDILLCKLEMLLHFFYNQNIMYFIRWNQAPLWHISNF